MRLVEEYLWLKTLERVAASADRQLKFTQQPLTRRASSPVKFVVPFWPTVSAQVEVIEVADSSLRLLDTEVAFDAKKSPTSSSGLLAVDFDNDLHTDLVIADQGGLLLLRNKTGKVLRTIPQPPDWTRPLLIAPIAAVLHLSILIWMVTWT